MLVQFIYTLSFLLGKVVASHAVVAISIPAEAALIYTVHKAHSIRVGGGTPPPYYCPNNYNILP